MIINEVEVFSDGEDYFKIVMVHDTKYLTCSYDYEVDDENNVVLCLYTSSVAESGKDFGLVRVFLGIKIWEYDIGVHSDKYSTYVTLHSKRSSFSINVSVEVYTVDG